MKQIWWDRVTNASRLKSDIIDALLEEKNILLQYNQSMPWISYFKESIQDEVKIHNADKKFEFIFGVKDPGKYLLESFCKKEKRSEFLPKKGYAKFFTNEDDIVIHDRYFWVTIQCMDELNAWTKLVSEYYQSRNKNKPRAVFILEWAGNEAVYDAKGIVTYSFDEYIGEYDRIVFAVLAASAVKESSFIRTYLAELLANVVENDIELCAECVGKYRDFLKSPHACIQKIMQNRSKQDEDNYRFKEHGEDEDKKVHHAIWRSQIKTIYPFIEEYRGKFVEKHAKAVSDNLPIRTELGEVYENVQEVELGTLCYLAASGKIKLSPEEHSKLKRFKDARNDLSHLRILTKEKIEGLL